MNHLDLVFDLLRAPCCGQRILAQGDHVICSVCQRKYPLRSGIPVLIHESSEPPASKPEGE